jgi:hypothetical protein
MTQQQQTYNTLDDIQARKTALKAQIQESGDKVTTLWHELAAPKPASTKGELVAQLVSNGITAIDGFLLVRRLVRDYAFLFNWGKRKWRK